MEAVSKDILSNVVPLFASTLDLKLNHFGRPFLPNLQCNQLNALGKLRNCSSGSQHLIYQMLDAIIGENTIYLSIPNLFFIHVVACI